MKIAFESELMENQKHAVVMAPDLAFEVLQSQDGDALFFSLGTDHVFYLTREVTQTSTGWTKVDLSSRLAAQHSGAAVAAKAFSVAQNAQTLRIDLALVLTVGGVDFLYLSPGNANTDAAWAHGVVWQAVPFDAGTAPSPLTITDVLLLNMPATGGAGIVENIFVDILHTPGDPLQLLTRYYIAPGSTPQWNLHELPASLAAGTITSYLGNRPHDPVPGIYTFGAINGERELFYTPQYNYFQPNIPPSPAYLTLPAGASAVASSLNGAGVSNLFVAGTGGLYLFTPDNQHDKDGQFPVPVQVVTGGLVAGATTLAAATTATTTTVWGLNPQGNLFYLSCSAGSEATAAAWSFAVPLLPSVEAFAFFLNLASGTSVLFAHIDGTGLVQLSQDPTTATWLQRSILLPSTSASDMAVYKSFTTHIQVTDDYGVGAPNAAVAVTATSPVSVYLNDKYHVLSPTVAVNATTDATGVLTVVQETQSLAAVCLQVVLTATPAVVASINPMSKALATLGTVQNGTDLGNVQVTNADGTQQALVPATVSANDKDAAAKSLAQFVQIAAGLPQNGARQAPTAPAMARLAMVAQPSTSWGISFTPDGLRYHEGVEADQLAAQWAGGPVAAQASRPMSRAAATSNPGAAIEVAAGDLFHWIKDAFDTVTSFVVQEAEGIYHFLATIGGQVYEALLDCVEAVVHAVEFVFNKIKVFFEDLIKWLGFLFAWGDIIRTHKVLKNVFKQYANRAVGRLATLETEVANAFDGLERRIDAWANIPGTTDTIGSYQASSAAPGSGSPQANWAMHHTKSNINAADTTYHAPDTDLGTLTKIFDDLEQLVGAEIQDLVTMVQRLKTDVVDKLPTLTAVAALKAIAAILTDALLTATKNILVTALDIIKVVVQDIVGLLDAPIAIPILSSIYKGVVGDELSFLDLACLLAAIPVTLIYKAALNEAPFSASEAQALSGAADFASLQTLLHAPAAPLARAATPQVAQQATDDPKPLTLLDKVTIAASYAGLAGAIGVALFAGLKKGYTETDKQPNKALRYLAAVTYLPYVAPDILQAIGTPTPWYTILNDIFTTLGVVKTFADNSNSLSDPQEVPKWSSRYSPVLESVLNVGWLVPAVGAIIQTPNPKTSDWLTLVGNLAFDLGGIITPGSENSLVKSPKINAACFVAMEVLTAGYGLLSMGNGIALGKRE